MAESFDPYYRWLGIRDAQRPLNHYRLLGLDPFEENLQVIQAAADRQMGHVRRFQTGPNAHVSQQVLNELARAKLCLLNPSAKQAYDHTLRVSLGLAPPPMAGIPQAARPVQPMPAPPVPILRPPSSFAVTPVPTQAAPTYTQPDPEDFLERLEQAPAAASGGASMEEEYQERSKMSPVTKGLVLTWSLMLVGLLLLRFTVWDRLFPPPPPRADGMQRKFVVIKKEPSQKQKAAKAKQAEKPLLEVQHTFVGHTAGVWTLAVAGNDQSFLSAGADRTLRNWNLASKEEVSQTKAEDFIQALAYSPKASQAVFGGQELMVRLWDVEENVVQKLVGSSAPVLALAFSPDGHLFAAGDERGGVSIYQFPQGTLLQQFEGHTTPVVGLGFVSKGQQLASLSRDGLLYFWEPTQQAAVRRVTAHEASATCLTVSSAGDQVFTAATDGTIRIWQASDASPLRTFTAHSSSISCLAVSPAGRSLVFGDKLRNVVLWDLARHQQVATAAGHKAGIMSVVFLHDGLRFLTSSADSTIKLWSFADLPPIKPTATP